MTLCKASALRSVLHGVRGWPTSLEEELDQPRCFPCLKKYLKGMHNGPTPLVGRGLCMSLSLWQALLWRRGRRASPLGLL